MAVKGKKKSKANTVTSTVINQNEFEGLVSFEEIPSYKLDSFNCGTGRHKKFQLLKVEKNPLYEKKKKKIVLADKNDLAKSKKSEKNKIDKDATKLKETTLKSSKKRMLNDTEEITSFSDTKKIKPTFNLKNDKLADVADIGEWRSIHTPVPVLEAIVELGFKKPTEIQRLTIPAAIRDHKDIVGAAETGSGKTLAFGIPIISGILSDREAEIEAESAMGEHESDSEDCYMDGNVAIDEGSVEDLGMMDVEESCSDNGNDHDDSECEEDTPMLNEEGIGCVKVIDGAKFSDGELLKKEANKNPLRALIITPTRELAVQIRNHLQAILTKTTIKICIVIGGMSQNKQERLLRRGPEIVIGTPGRLWEMIQHGDPHLGQIADIRYLAIDETDRMLEKDHFDELRNLLDLLPKNTNRRQTFIFSATLTMIHAPPRRILADNKKPKCQTKDSKLTSLLRQAGVRKKPKIVDITRALGTAETLSEARVYCAKEEKDLYLYYFVKMFPGRTLVFCNSINCVRRLTNLFEVLHCDPRSLFANKHQKQRLKSLEQFASSPQSLLLATDIAARGLDITGIDHIVHYEVPRTAEGYIHRSGRTARASQEGLSVIFVQPNEMNKFRQLCKTLNRDMDLPPFPVDTSILRELGRRIDLARNIELCEFREKRKSMDNRWWKQMSIEAGIELDDDLSEDEAVHMSMGRKKQLAQLKSYKRHLNALIDEPILLHGMSTRYPTKTGKLEAPGKCCMGSAGSALALVKKENVGHNKAVKNFKVKLPKEKKSKKMKGFERRKKRREDERFEDKIAEEEDRLREQIARGEA